MNQLAFILSVFMVATLAKPLSGSNADIVATGVTRVTLDAGSIEVELFSRSIDSHRRPRELSDRTSNCTFTYSKCVLLSRVRILVQNRDVPVPRSVFADLGDVKYVRLNQKGPDEYALSIQCGQASETYLMTAVFSNERVLYRTIASDLDSAQIIEKTEYHSVVIGD